MRDIFVQIAAYRDEDLPATLENLLERAVNPERLHIAICLQLKPSDPPSWRHFPEHERLDVVEFDAADSKGACWARRQAQEFYRGEEFLLQIDSHMRAVWGWDQMLLEMWDSCEDENAVLSVYPPAFDQPCNLCDDGLPVMRAKEFNQYGLLMFTAALQGFRPEKPIPGAFMAGGFMFGPGSIVERVPYDPGLYFYGEEINMSVRLFTHGYNLYAPNSNVLFHLYKKGKGIEPTHWGDNSQKWWALNRKAMVRVNVLCDSLVSCPTDLKPTADDLVGLSDYWLGNERSLADFERMAGVDFKGQHIVNKVVPDWSIE